MNDLPVLVVGAGPSGLGCASAVARERRVLLFDRIPVTGGTAGWDHPDIARFTDAAVSAGVELRLGESALRWDGRRLLVASPGAFDQVSGQHLFFAGGLRPATLANLHIDGDRPAGVIAGTVAEHLLHAGVRLWNRAVIIGDGPWARTVAAECRHLGTRVIAVADRVGPAHDVDWADERYDRSDSIRIVGRARVTRLELVRSTGTTDIACDAVILAADPRPNRNIEGALLDGASGVSYLQPVYPLSPTDRYHAGQQAARHWFTTNGDGS